MNIKRYGASALTVVALAVGATVAGPSSVAQAATPSCDFFSLSYGTGWGASMYTHVPVNLKTKSYTCGMTTALGRSNNAGVSAMQNVLRKCYRQNIANDGHFGPATKQALMNVQRRLGVRVDGAWGPQTSAAILYPVYTHGGGYQGKCYPRNFFKVVHVG